jgi:hypothetical protein
MALDVFWDGCVYILLSLESGRVSSTASELHIIPALKWVGGISGLEIILALL